MSVRGAMSAGLVARSVRLLDERGPATDAILASAGLTREMLTTRGARLSYGTVDCLIERMSEHVPAHELGLNLARVADEAAYGPAGLLLLTSNSLRQGLKLAIGYQRIWGDGERFNVCEPGGTLRVEFLHPGASTIARAILAECALAEVLAGARALVDAKAVPCALEFAHEPLGDGRQLSEHFGRHWAPATTIPARSRGRGVAGGAAKRAHVIRYLGLSERSRRCGLVRGAD